MKSILCCLFVFTIGTFFSQSKKELRRQIEELKKDTSQMIAKRDALGDEKNIINIQIANATQKQVSTVEKNEIKIRTLRYRKLSWDRSYERILQVLFKKLDELKNEKSVKYKELKKDYVPVIESFLTDKSEPLSPPYVDENDKPRACDPLDGFDRLRLGEYDFSLHFNYVKDETISFRLIISSAGIVIHTEVIASKSTTDNRDTLRLLDTLIKRNIRYSKKEEANPEYVFLTVKLKANE